MATGGVPNLTPQSSKEKINYARLCRAIIDIGTEVLRAYLNRHIQPVNILNNVIRCPNLKLMPPFMVKVNNAQTQGYSKFDISLLYILIKKLCQAQISPTRGWIPNLNPLPSETTEGDDVERIHLIRNRIYGHIPNTCVRDTEYSRCWKELEGIVHRYDSKYGTSYTSQLTYIANQCMDDVTEKLYMDKIKELNEQDAEIRDELKKVKAEVTEVKELSTSTEAAVMANTRRLTEVEGELAEVKDISTSTAAAVTATDSRLAIVKDEVAEVKDFSKSTEAAVTATSSRLERVEAEVTEVKELSTSTEAAVMANTRRLTEVEGELAEVKDISTSTAAAVTATDSRLAIVKDEVAEVKDFSKSTEAAVTATSSRLERVEAEVTEVKELSTSKEAAVMANTRRLAEVEGELAEVKDISTSMEAAVTATDSRLVIVEGQVEAVKTLTEGHLKDRETEFDDQYSSFVRDLKQEDSVFVATRGTQKVKEAIKNNSIVTVTGNMGAGKSATVIHVAIQLENEGYQILPVVYPEDIRRYLFKSKKQVFVLEDPIGIHGLDKDIFKVWLKHNKILLSVISGNTKMLCSIRKEVMNDPDFKLENTVFNKTVVDLQDEKIQLDEKEKLSMINQHFQINKICMTISEKAKLIFGKVKELFPLLCKLFSTNNELRRFGWDFFSDPFPVILKDLEKMQSYNKVKYDVLVLCFVFGNKLDLNLFSPSNPKNLKSSADSVIANCDIDLRVPLSEYSKGAKSLVGVYLRQEAGIYKFSHDLIFDVVAFHFGSTCPQLLLKVSTSKFICNRILVNKSHAKENDPHVIILSPEYYINLIKRLLDDLNIGIYNYCFMNKCWDDDRFFKSFITFVSEKNENDLSSGIKKVVLSMFIKANQINAESIVQECEYIETEDPVSTWSWYYSAVIELSSSGCTALHWIAAFRHTKLFFSIWENLTSDQKEQISETVPLLNLVFLGGDLELCKAMLSCESSKYNKSYNEKLLHNAVEGADADVVELLIARGVDINDHKYMYKRTALHIAAGCGNTSAVDILLKNQADIDVYDINGITSLMLASQNGHTSTVELLLRKGASIDMCDNKGYTSLMLASLDGHTSTVELLLRKGASIDMCDNDGSTSLMLASQNGNTSTVELLLLNGAGIDMCSNKGNTSLMLASQDGHTSTVELLLLKGASVDMCDSEGNTSLMLASLDGHTSTVELLLLQGASIDMCDNEGFTSLMSASQNGHTSIVEILLRKGASIDMCNNDGFTSLMLASQDGHTSTVELLLRKGASIDMCDNEGNTSLMLASENGHTGTVELLLLNGAGIDMCDSEGNTSLMLASLDGHTSTVELLLLKGASIDMCDNEGFTSLMSASQNGHASIVEILLRKGASIDMCNNKGTTSLMLASQNGHTSTVELLLLQGASIDMCDNEGNTSLMLASQDGHTSTVELLLLNGAGIDMCNSEGNTSLMLASLDGHTSTVELLLLKGASIDMCDNEGNTSLMSASQNGHTSIVEILLRKGASIDMCNNKGTTSLMLASQNGHTSTVELLLLKGASVDMCSNKC